MQTAVILNSRQNLRPCRKDLWVRKSIEAVEFVQKKGYRLMVSHGTKPWEIVLTEAVRRNIAVTLYLPDSDNPEYRNNLTEQFHLDKTDLNPVPADRNLERGRLFQNNRDRMIIAEADILIPVSLRSGGTMQRLVNDCKNTSSIINEDFRCDYQTDRENHKIEIDRARINWEIDQQLDSYIIHWTRSSNNPWPGETAFDYYCSLLDAKVQYPRDALTALNRIIDEKLLRASSRHFRKAYPAVAFSELTPGEAASLMKWRARYREMSFEPYGLAIPMEEAAKVGIKKVIYGMAYHYGELAENERPYFQAIGEKGFWIPEKEWRYIGNLDLNRLDLSRLSAIVWNPEDIANVSRNFAGNIVSFYS